MLRRQHFESHNPVELLVDRPKDRAHPTAPNSLLDHKMGELQAGDVSD
jgi:hypothetical protein